MNENHRWKNWCGLSEYYQQQLIDIQHLKNTLFLTGLDAKDFKNKFLTTSTTYPSQFFNHFTQHTTYLSEDKQVLKKWLFHHKIAFSKDVFVISDHDLIIQTKWKHIISNVDHLSFIFSHFFIVLDHTQQWALSYHHHQIYTYYYY